MVIAVNNTLVSIGQFNIENKLLLGQLFEAGFDKEIINKLHKKNNGLLLSAMQTSDEKTLNGILDELDALYDHIKYEIMEEK